MSKLTLTRSEAETMGVALGWKTCTNKEKWSDERLLKKMKRVATEDTYQLPNGEDMFNDEDLKTKKKEKNTINCL